MEVTIPHNYTPRPYQLPVLRALDNGIDRVVAVWHRRSGKEKTFFNHTVKRAFKRIGSYYYIFPTYAQGKKILWNGKDRDGFPFMSHIPQELITKSREDEMRKELVGGSAIQILGSDNIDSIVGTNPVGVVFSEFSLQNPNAWDFIRPILKENGGWAIFDFTPRGKNHGYQIYQIAKSNPDTWFAEILTVDDTKALPLSAIDEERRDGMGEELIQQEYYCSFEGVLQGSIFGRQLNEAEREGRICAVPHQADIVVDTWWDIGTGDPTAIWFTQDIGREVHVIDYYENSGAGIGVDHYAKYLQQLPYVFGEHNGPHDLDQHQFAAGGKSTKEVAQGLGIKFKVVGKLDKQSQINSGRAFMKRCVFDRKKCERGINALTSYHFKWDDNRKMFGDDPYHDWASNGSDAYMQLAVGHKRALVAKAPQEIIVTAYDRAAQEVSWLAT